MPWLALTLEVAAAQAETLSDALVEQGAHSVWIDDPGRPSHRLHALFDARANAAALLGAASARSEGQCQATGDARSLALPSALDSSHAAHRRRRDRVGPQTES